MTDAMSSHECKSFRSAIEAKLDSGGRLAELVKLSEHRLLLNSCASCADWCRQTNDLLSAAAVLPQFDVSEALTQRILSAVQAERQSSVTAKEIVLTAAVLGLAVAFVALESFESISGLLAWFAGVAAVAVLKVLLSGPVPAAEVIES